MRPQRRTDVTYRGHKWTTSGKVWLEALRILAIIRGTVAGTDTVIAAAKHNAASARAELGKEIAHICGIVQGNLCTIISETSSGLEGLGPHEQSVRRRHTMY